MSGSNSHFQHKSLFTSYKLFALVSGRKKCGKNAKEKHFTIRNDEKTEHVFNKVKLNFLRGKDRDILIMVNKSY